MFYFILFGVLTLSITTFFFYAARVFKRFDCLLKDKEKNKKDSGD